MMQPAPGAVPPPPPPMNAHQYQYQQQPPQPSPYMMMMPPQPQAQPPAMWATQAAAPQAAVPPQHQAHQHGQQVGHPGEIRTLWIGDLQYWMDENYISSCFAHTGEVYYDKMMSGFRVGSVA